jgi:hypothetical protein
MVTIPSSSPTAAAPAATTPPTTSPSTPIPVSEDPARPRAHDHALPLSTIESTSPPPVHSFHPPPPKGSARDVCDMPNDGVCADVYVLMKHTELEYVLRAARCVRPVQMSSGCPDRLWAVLLPSAFGGDLDSHHGYWTTLGLTTALLHHNALCTSIPV